MQGQCKQCGVGEFLPFKCRFCGDVFCSDHRLPEGHGCRGLADARVRPREITMGTRERAPVGRNVPTSRRMYVRARSWFMGSLTTQLIAVIVAGFFAQWLGGAILGVIFHGGPSQGVLAFTKFFAAGPIPAYDVWGPNVWGPLTSLFLHGYAIPGMSLGGALYNGVFHLVFNLLALYFFGMITERRLGARRGLLLFLFAGVVGAIAQTALGSIVVGASAGVLAFVAFAAVLHPNERVLFFFVPVPLWLMAVFIVLMNVTVVVGAIGGLAAVAHLVGFGIGAAYGWRVRTRGVFLRSRSGDLWQRGAE